MSNTRGSCLKTMHAAMEGHPMPSLKCIVCHGTGSRNADAVEAEALSKVILNGTRKSVFFG